MEFELPKEVVRFIKEKKIYSMAQIEVLLLLWRDAGKCWTPESVGVTLRSNVESARGQLEHLQNSDLVEYDNANSGYRFRIPIKTVEETIATLAELFDKRRSSLVNHIYAQPNDHIRLFADAFKIRKD